MSNPISGITAAGLCTNRAGVCGGRAVCRAGSSVPVRRLDAVPGQRVGRRQLYSAAKVDSSWSLGWVSGDRGSRRVADARYSGPLIGGREIGARATLLRLQVG